MSRSFAAITYALKQVKKMWKSWEISRPFELKEPDSNDLRVNEPWEWKQSSAVWGWSVRSLSAGRWWTTVIVKNHCVNVLIKLNNPQCILYKTCLRNLFFFKFWIKEEHFVQTRLSPISSDWLLLLSIESKYRKVWKATSLVQSQFREFEILILNPV